MLIGGSATFSKQTRPDEAGDQSRGGVRPDLPAAGQPAQECTLAFCFLMAQLTLTAVC